MKKILFVLIACVCMSLMSCDQVISRKFGGNTTINLKPGERLVEATWKENNIWYLVEHMDSNYEPKVKTLKESSVLGVAEGSITFIETR